jgi:hypothetical protein
MSPGREAGPVCRVSCPTPGRAKCTCNLPPNHGGDLHWCFGLAPVEETVDVSRPMLEEHGPHSW